ncbi:MAG: nucleoside diphosphate kinase regulator [Bacteroidales bacterium]|nr:nucleoside diphosphate kinase regulator [Bacteroidales bacterium]
MKKIILNRIDHARIRKRIINALEARSIESQEAEMLLSELARATIVEPEEMPSDVVTMHSVVTLRFLNNNRKLKVQLVYPDEANLRENKISIFSPVATAIIGYRAGDEIDWAVPGGMTRIRIEDIIYQPEAMGDYNL